MGYTKLTYENYQEHLDYWLGSKGVELPLWANEISEQGYKSVCALDFYDDLFGDDLEESHKDHPEDYQTGEYGAIAVELIPTNNKKKFRGERVTVTEGNRELYDLIDRSKNFCMIAPVSYVGLQRTNKNARYLYALVIEIDDIEPKNGIDELFYSWKRIYLTMPQPTYVVCSGSGLHLYFVFERPIPLFQHMFEQLTAVKRHFTKLFWNRYVTNSHQPEKIQYESINQSFRCVGSVTKSGRAYAMAFETGKKITIEYLNNLLPQELQINEVYKSKLPLEKAKEIYPDWYQRRIVNGEARGNFTRNPGIYYNWIEKIKNGAVVGHRYNCLENLCSLAVQCNIAPEQVEKDCRELAVVLEELTVKEDNHFTEYDILCALNTYHKADEGAYRRKLEYVANKTGIPLTPNKRNGRPQEQHIKIMNAVRDVLYPDGNWRKGSGRKQKKHVVAEWRKAHPSGKKADCIRDTGLDKKTVYKWWES